MLFLKRNTLLLLDQFLFQFDFYTFLEYTILFCSIGLEGGQYSMSYLQYSYSLFLRSPLASCRAYSFGLLSYHYRFYSIPSAPAVLLYYNFFQHSSFCFSRPVVQVTKQLTYYKSPLIDTKSCKCFSIICVL